MNRLSLLMVGVFCMTIGTGTIMAGNGTSAQQAAGAGAAVVCDGTPFTITGTVVQIGIPGEGMVVDTGSAVITIFGIGSLDYWAANTIARPAIGEAVVVTGYTVDFTDRTLNIATAVVVGETMLVLRDPLTCVPLWRRAP